MAFFQDNLDKPTPEMQAILDFTSLILSLYTIGFPGQVTLSRLRQLTMHFCSVSLSLSNNCHTILKLLSFRLLPALLTFELLYYGRPMK